MATVRCESCGAEQETNLLGDSDPVCESCGSRTLTQVEDETVSATPDATPSETGGGAATGGAAEQTVTRQTTVEQTAGGQTAGRDAPRRATHPEEVPFAPGAIFEILADDRRRYLLYYLREVNGRGTLPDAVDQLAAWENGTTVDALEPSARKTVAIDLYHAVLPELDDVGLVDFDPETGKVAATPDLRRIAPFLDFARAAEPADHERFLDLLDDREAGDGGSTPDV